MTLWDLDDCAGIARVGDDWHPRRVPGLHPAGQVHGVVTALEKHSGCPLRASADATDGDDRLVLVEAVHAGCEGRQRHVHGVGGVPGVPLVGFPYVEENGALVDPAGCLFGTDGGYVRLALHTTTL